MRFTGRTSGRPLLLASWLVITTIGEFQPASAEDGPPNFVLFLADDQGWAGTSVRMDPELDATSLNHRTPNLARLAEEGMRFTQGYAPAALCCPTRRSLQFGQTPLRQGDDDAFARRIPTQNDRPTIPRLLKAADPRYAAAHFGKWDLRREESRGTTPLAPEHLGYDESDGNTDNSPGSEGDNGDPDPISKKDKWSKHVLLKDPKRIFSITERASDFISRMAMADRPFYVQLSHYAVHADYQCRAESYAAACEQSPDAPAADAAFAAMTEDLDAGLGQLLNHLDSLGLRDNTYVIYLADNGGVPFVPPDREEHFANPESLTERGLNNPLRGGKWTLFEGGIRVPFIVRGPGVQAGAVCRVPVVGWDLLPTIADLAGYNGALPDDLDGGSFRSLLENGGQGTVARPREALVFHRYSGSYGHSAIRFGDYKLIRFWQKDVPFPLKTYYLFNLADDLGETDNLADAMPDKVEHLERQLMNYLHSVDSNAATPSLHHSTEP